MKTLLETGNLTAAIPLLRLQLDNLLRLTYLVTLPNDDEFSKQVLEGKHTRSITDAQGRKLTDARLRDYARPHYPWIDDIYNRASGLVHFSDVHVFRAVKTEPEKGPRDISFQVGHIPWPDHVGLEVEETFGYVTGQILSVVEQWGQHKATLAARRVHPPCTPATRKGPISRPVRFLPGASSAAPLGRRRAVPTPVHEQRRGKVAVPYR
jgi:hypothetical protein